MIDIATVKRFVSGKILDLETLVFERERRCVELQLIG
jgi:hypothetical protein